LGPQFFSRGGRCATNLHGFGGSDHDVQACSNRHHPEGRRRSSAARFERQGFETHLRLLRPEAVLPAVPIGNSILLATDIESGDAPALCERFVA
jgi:hypothetical protein